MNAIIVGPDGRQSILDMIIEENLKNHVYVYTYRTLKNGDRSWYRYDSKNLSNVIDIKESPSFSEKDKVLFWGTRVSITTNGAIVYNNPRSLSRASDKAVARMRFRDAGIPSPMLISTKELDHVSYPVIIRRTHHHGGMYFYVANDKEEVYSLLKKFIKNGDYYISEVYPKTEEYRVHCASGKALLVKRKPTPDNPNEIAWNFHINEKPWTTINRKDYNPDMIKMALDAVEVLGLDFGAVDIMSKPKIKGFPEHVVLEVNTAPSFTPYLIQKYGMYFDLLFSKDNKAEHWDYKAFKKGPSLAWKNEQLRNGVIKSEIKK